MFMSADIEQFFATHDPKLTGWVFSQTKEPYVRKEENLSISGLRADFFLTTVGGEEYSVGVFSWRGSPALIAWGKRHNADCGMHSVWQNGSWTPPVPGCPDFTVLCDTQDTVIGFTVGESRFV